MTTLLAHIRIKSGCEAQFEAITKDMVSRTLNEEEGVLRYEYWKGQDENFWYCLLSFKDKWAFYEHQMSDYHEGHDFAAVIEDIRLEYLDPVKGAGGDLPPTEDQPLPDDASEDQRIAQERYALTIPAWWEGRL
ncbi:MAG: antibiotic biosynthesis monooxygenase [Erythrobacter sp.]